MATDPQNGKASSADGEPMEPVSEMTGREPGLPALEEFERSLLQQFKGIAKSMGLHQAPKVFLYGELDGPIDAFATESNDGKPLVFISRGLLKAQLEAPMGEIKTSPLERIAAAIGHEEAHLKHNDARKSGSDDLKSIRMELAADKEGAQATCDPQAAEDMLNVEFQADATRVGMPLKEYILDQAHGDAGGDAHPLLPTRIALMEYLKEHPSRRCKTK